MILAKDANIPMNDSISIKQITLEKIKFQLHKFIPNHYLTDVDFIAGDFSKDAYLELRQDIWAEKLQDTTQRIKFEFTYPSSWWQYFKKDYFPKWLLQRYPVKERGYVEYKKVNFKRYAAFPEFRHATERGRDKFVMHEYIVKDYSK